MGTSEGAADGFADVEGFNDTLGKSEGAAEGMIETEGLDDG